MLIWVPSMGEPVNIGMRGYLKKEVWGTGYGVTPLQRKGAGMNTTS
jgi:squalene cyclase